MPPIITQLRTEMQFGSKPFAPRHLTADECVSLWTQAAKQAEAAAANAWLNYLLNPSETHRAIYMDAMSKVQAVTDDLKRITEPMA